MDNLLIGDFEGPLDLLLHLIKKSKMEIFDIEISDITNKYLEYIEKMTEMNLDVASEYLVMASELIHLKSRLLLHLDNDDDDSPELNSFSHGVFCAAARAEKALLLLIFPLFHIFDNLLLKNYVIMIIVKLENLHLKQLNH